MDTLVGGGAGAHPAPLSDPPPAQVCCPAEVHLFFSFASSCFTLPHPWVRRRRVRREGAAGHEDLDGELGAADDGEHDAGVVVRLLACALVVLRRRHLRFRGRHGRSSRPAVQGQEHASAALHAPAADWQSTERGYGL